MKVNKRKWPELSYETGKGTCATLHMWTQIVGKIKLGLMPWVNHSWHIALHITPVGLSTYNIPYQNSNFQIDFDFISHQLKIVTNSGESREFDLEGNSVADFYEKIFGVLSELGIILEINTKPVEVEHLILFEKDIQHNIYDKHQAASLHQAILNIQGVLSHMRCNFTGKCSPVHFFWGSFDLAVSRFSGRKAPKHPGGIPNLPDWVAEEAYSHEVTSFGFWPGSEALPEAAFYSYIYPAPDGYEEATIKPNGAYFHKTLGEFVLPYKNVQESNNPEDQVMEFQNSAYEIAANLAKWDRELLET